MAILEGGDPAAAARAAVPSWTGARAAVKVDGRTVRVALRPPGVIPALSSLLTAHATRVGRPVIGAIARWFVAPEARRTPIEPSDDALGRPRGHAVHGDGRGSWRAQEVGESEPRSRLRFSAGHGARCALVAGWRCAAGANLGVALPATSAAPPASPQRLSHAARPRRLRPDAWCSSAAAGRADAVVVARRAMRGGNGDAAPRCSSRPSANVCDRPAARRTAPCHRRDVGRRPRAVGSRARVAPARRAAVALPVELGAAAAPGSLAGFGLAPALRATLQPASTRRREPASRAGCDSQAARRSCCSSARCWPCWPGRSCSAALRAGSDAGGSARARPTSPRSPAPGRCARPIHGCIEPPLLDGRPNPAHLERGDLPGWGARAGERTARDNGAQRVA